MGRLLLWSEAIVRLSKSIKNSPSRQKKFGSRLTKCSGEIYRTATVIATLAGDAAKPDHADKLIDRFNGPASTGSPCACAGYVGRWEQTG